MGEELLLLLSEGYLKLNPAQQKEIYLMFYRLSYRSVFMITKDHSATEDIIQDSFLKVIAKMPSIADIGKLKNWLKTVTRNTAYNYLRKNKKERSHVELESAGLIYAHHDKRSVEQMVESRLFTESILYYLEGLRQDHRILIELRWKKGLSYKEISEILEISQNVVKQRMHRARLEVKKKMNEDWDMPS